MRHSCTGETSCGAVYDVKRNGKKTGEVMININALNACAKHLELGAHRTFCSLRGYVTFMKEG